MFSLVEGFLGCLAFNFARILIHQAKCHLLLSATLAKGLLLP